MSQKSSLPQAISFVSQVLKWDKDLTPVVFHKIATEYDLARELKSTRWTSCTSQTIRALAAQSNRCDWQAIPHRKFRFSRPGRAHVDFGRQVDPMG
jgi:hypothetical protein